MTITTKYVPRDMVYFIRDSKIEYGKILWADVRIEYHGEALNTKISYYISDNSLNSSSYSKCTFKEDELFSTKDALIASL